MTRADRLFDLAERLRGYDATTVDQLADELGVSPRTLYRDLATLRDRGMPIEGEAGPGGGIRLSSDRGVTAVHLSLAEVVSLWLAARLSQSVAGLPWSGDARSALAKLLASLPRDKARDLRALCRRVWVGPLASAAVRESAAAPPPDLLRWFEHAFSRGLGLAFQYRDRSGNASVRRVEPHGLLVEPPVWYVLARDLDKDAPRTFRMDRIARPRVLDDVRFRPDPAVARALLLDDERWQPLSA